jgi:hypothetical protein
MINDDDDDDDDENDRVMKRKIKIERSDYEMHLRRINILLKSIQLPEEGEVHLSIESMMSLMIVRSQLIASVIESSLHKKRELYESFGVDLDLDILRPSEAGEGREMHALHDMINSFHSILETVSACMLMQSYGPVDSIRRLQAERDELKKKLESTINDLHMVQGDLVAEKNAKRNFGEETQGAATLQVQLRAEKRKSNSLIKDLKVQWEISAKKDDAIQKGKEEVARIHSLRKEDQNTHHSKTKLLIPHVEHLESSVESISKAYR